MQRMNGGSSAGRKMAPKKPGMSKRPGMTRDLPRNGRKPAGRGAAARRPMPSRKPGMSGRKPGRMY